MKSRISNRTLSIIIEHDKTKILSVDGSDSLWDIIKEFFEREITTIESRSDDFLTSATTLRTLNPGDAGYVQAVLLDRIQSEFNYDVEWDYKEEETEE